MPQKQIFSSFRLKQSWGLFEQRQLQWIPASICKHSHFPFPSLFFSFFLKAIKIFLLLEGLWGIVTGEFWETMRAWASPRSLASIFSMVFLVVLCCWHTFLGFSKPCCTRKCSFHCSKGSIQVYGSVQGLTHSSHFHPDWPSPILSGRVKLHFR